MGNDISNAFPRDVNPWSKARKWKISIEYKDGRNKVVSNQVIDRKNAYFTISDIKILEWNHDNIKITKVNEKLWIVWIIVHKSTHQITKIGLHCISQRDADEWKDIFE